ncbi:hypothetical protein CANINC_003765 [Pichia inconspicua]|uniref:Major facilitator superfamily (MFS) profile domain-containing protein n=1 Tax=Pichia inconspicua TaxID=52247 RepID=A0A4V4NFD0_9ASCO|nr:hypothetical protein CANINC_003765 [[Candida] inconspicua]
MPFKELPNIIRSEVTWGRNIVSDSSNEMRLQYTDKEGNDVVIEEENITPSDKKSYWPIFTAGAGLFSDGYVNNSIGITSTCLSIIYGTQYTQSSALKNVSAIAFAGTIVGQLSFGVFSDYISRKMGMLVSSGGLILFSILAAGSWGVGTEPYGNAGGIFAALTAYRFFLGFFIGAEYPTGSAACAEASALLPVGKRNRYFTWFTNFMIDLGFVMASFVPMVLLWIFREDKLQWVWRLTLGFGAIPPISLFFMRMFFKEGKQFQKLNFKKTKIPFLLILKFYWFRLTIVSVIWFIYNFSAYAFGIYASPILRTIIPDGDIYKTFGWNVVFNVFYLPGAFLGAISTDYIGPRLTLFTGIWLQAIVGFIMAGLYQHLSEHVAAFTVVYGIFMTLGEFGPGDNIGLLAAKTSATPVRGVYYGIAAATGKVGAFVGTYVFPTFQSRYPGIKGYQVPFWLASSLALFAGLLALFGLPAVDQNAMQREDFLFLQYLSDNGFDITKLGDGTLTNGEVNNSDSSDQEIQEAVEFLKDEKY